MRFINKKGFVVIAILILIIAGFYAFYSSKHDKNGSNGINTGTYYDPYSHETISNPAGKTPDTYGVPQNKPVYLGFDKLLNYGIELSQLNDIELAFYNYSNSLSTPLKEISVDVNSINSAVNQNSSTPFTINFTVVFDGKSKYQAKAQYSGLKDMHLFIMDPSNKTVYDSGVLGNQE